MTDRDAPSVAIIMDGNARWADERSLPVLEGHREGAQALKRTVRNALSLGVGELCVYAFSTENWSRPSEEVQGLMALFVELIESETPELDEEGVRMRFIGRPEGISAELHDRMRWAEAETSENNRMALYVAFNYGGRAEILDAAARYKGGGEAEFKAALYAPEMRDADLVIRTSGERRLSNFLLWQSAYSELYFSDALWPEFDKEHLEEALRELADRQRRFGAR
jgi:undecaprenyl diphosphate synthase